MASIYHTGTGTAIADVVATGPGLYDNRYSSTATAAIGNSLDKFLYTTATDENLYHMRSIVNDSIANHIYTGGTASTSTAITTGTATGTATLDTDLTYNPFTNGLNIQVDYLSEEEKKQRQKEQIRMLKQKKIRSNLLVMVKPRGTSHKYVPENERIAMETLREYITETEFRKYLRFGFLSVEGKSGKTYQVFRNGSHTKVWKNGKIIEEICVNIKNSKVPPTDSVIAFRTMIQTSEEDFHKLGNVYNMRRAA